MRYFLAQLAKAVRRVELEVHALCLMLNHFHLLVRSPLGRLSRAMQRVLNSYVRYFNRTRRRDGPLFRSRFRSQPVRSLAYRRLLVRYIDDNPVSAGMVRSAERYPWGSALRYARADGPIWLERTWIESEVRAVSGSEYHPRDYFGCFPSRLPEPVRLWIERRLERGRFESDDLDDLLAATPAEFRDWMQRKAHMADGTMAGQVLVPAEAVESALDRMDADWVVSRGERDGKRPALPLAFPGLLRDLCGLSLSEIASRLGVPKPTLQHRVHEHRRALQSDPLYAERCASAGYFAMKGLKQALTPGGVEI